MNIVLNNKKSVPSIGYGTFPQKETLLENIPIAIKCGYALIDTSDNYNNEEYIGNAMKLIAENEDVLIISKFSQPYKTNELEKCFFESKEKLNGRLNIYLLHWPYPFLWKIQWKKMERLYLKGEVDAIGVCNFEKKHLKKLLSFCKVRPAINQIEVHPLFQQKDTVKFCKDNNIQIMCYSPVARMNKALIDDPTLNEIARKYNKSVSQIILRWDVEKKVIPIPGASSNKHINSNFSIFDFSLTDDEIKSIDSLDAGLRIRYSPRDRFAKKEKFKFLKCRIKILLGVK